MKKKRKRWRKKKEKSLESTVASGMRGGGLSAQEGGLVRSCMFGSIQYVHVVNMKAGNLYAQQKQIQLGNQWACFLFSIMILMVHSWLHVNRTKTQTKSKCDSGIDSNTVLHSTLEVHITKTKKDRRSDYTCAQEYKEEIQRVIEETRQHVQSGVFTRWELSQRSLTRWWMIYWTLDGFPF